MISGRRLFLISIPFRNISSEQIPSNRTTKSSKSLQQIQPILYKPISQQESYQPVYTYRSDIEIMKTPAFSYDSYIAQDDNQNAFIHFTKTQWFDVVTQQYIQKNEKNIYIVNDELM